MKVHVWDKKDFLNNQSLLERKDKNEEFFLYGVLEKYLNETPPLSTVEIETLNYCNGTCSFCPVSVGNDRRQRCIMSDDLFCKIIDELAYMKYQGILCLSGNNEPMLDSRLPDFLAYARNKLPAAKHLLYTNGSKLTRENYASLLKMLDYLFIDNYNDDLKVLPHLNWLASEHFDEGNCHVYLLVRKKTQILYSRGGKAPNKQNDFLFWSPCVLPFLQMVVRPDGKISLCSHDAYGDITLGDLQCQSIKEVWKSEAYQNIRKNLLARKRGALPLCRHCDLFGFHHEFPSKWVDDYARTLVDKVWHEMENGKTVCVYSSGYDAERVINLLRHHGIWEVCRITEKSPEFFSESAFVIFTDYHYDLLEKIDPQNTRIGEKYVVFRNLEIELLKTLETRHTDLKELFYKVIAASQSGRLAVFGAGLTAERLVNSLALNVQYYMDNNLEKQKTLFLGKSVRNPKGYTRGDYVLIAAMDERAMHNQLLESGISEEMLINGWRLL